MAFKLNEPPNTVVVNPIPSTEELAQRSFNLTSKLRRSLDGRSFITSLNGFSQNQVSARKALADIYPSGVDSSLDFEKSRGGTSGIRPEP